MRPNSIAVRLAAALGSSLAAALPLSAAMTPKELLPEVAFPSARDYFEPLTADPTELGYGGRMIYPVGGPRFGEIGIGDYVGLFRWRSGSWGVQLNLGGGVLGRFNLSTRRNNLEVADFTAAIPVDINYDGRHTLRMSYWHASSHQGDDYIARVKPAHLKRAWDLWRPLYSYTPTDRLRAYAGGGVAFNTVNIRGRTMFQCGLELATSSFWEGKGSLFLAQDLQAQERVGWNPSYNIRGGLRLTDEKRIAAASLFMEYYTGHQYVLQFFEAHESHWGFGIKFEIGNPIRAAPGSMRDKVF